MVGVTASSDAHDRSDSILTSGVSTQPRLSALLGVLPMRDGVAPSYAWLPHGDWATLGSYLAVRFPMVPEHAWRARMARGDVRDDHGRTLAYDESFVGKRTAK